MWGSTLLAAVNASSDMVPLAGTTPAHLAAAFRRSPPPPDGSDYADLVFTAATAGCGAAAFIPIGDVVFEPFAAVVRTALFSGTTLAFNGSAAGATLPGSAVADFEAWGGAAVQPEGSGGGLILRSGAPQTASVAAYAPHVAPDASGAGVLTGISFAYSYASGFEGAGTAANFSLVALRVDPCADGPGPIAAVLYASPPLAAFPYSACDEFSPMEPGGYLAAGDDLWSGTVSLAEAEARCQNLTECLGFTYSGPLDPPGPVDAYLKSAVNFVEAPGWQAFISSRVSESEEGGEGGGPSQQQQQARGHGAPAAGGAAHSHGQSSHAATHSHGHHSHHYHGHPAAPLGKATSPSLRRLLRADPASCFSPPVPVSVSGLSLPLPAGGLQFALAFDNNDRNVRLRLPQPLELRWAAQQ